MIATGMDGMESSNNSELEHDNASSQIERLNQPSCSPSDVRTVRILIGRSTKIDTWSCGSATCSLLDMSTASRLCRSYGVCKGSEGRQKCVLGVERTEDSD